MNLRVIPSSNFASARCTQRGQFPASVRLACKVYQTTGFPFLFSQSHTTMTVRETASTGSNPKESPLLRQGGFHQSLLYEETLIFSICVSSHERLECKDASGNLNANGSHIVCSHLLVPILDSLAIVSLSRKP